MSIAGLHWMNSYLLNTHRMFAVGSIDDFTGANPARFDLLNLQLVLFPLLGSRLWPSILACCVGCACFGSWLLTLRKRGYATDGLLDLAILATISLLPFYHRFTDGCILLPACAWAVREFARSRASIARAILALAAPFLVPGAAALQALVNRSARLDTLAQHWWWQTFVAPYQVWLVLAISVLLLIAQRYAPKSAQL
jgi:hypothetical protein